MSYGSGGATSGGDARGIDVDGAVTTGGGVVDDVVERSIVDTVVAVDGAVTEAGATVVALGDTESVPSPQPAATRSTLSPRARSRTLLRRCAAQHPSKCQSALFSARRSADAASAVATSAARSTTARR